jgi:GH18 family chitinase
MWSSRRSLVRLALTLSAFGSSSLAQTPHPLLTGYFPQWGLYEEPRYTVKNLADQAGMLDQIDYAQGFVTGGRCVPFYGYGWRLVPEDNNSLFQEGEPIRGDRPYREIEARILTSRVYRDPNSQAPWLFDGDVFWTYEDPVSVAAKASYAIDQGMGGLMIWELGQDNASGSLLHAASQALRAAPTSQRLTAKSQ